MWINHWFNLSVQLWKRQRRSVILYCIYDFRSLCVSFLNQLVDCHCPFVLIIGQCFVNDFLLGNVKNIIKNHLFCHHTVSLYLFNRFEHFLNVRNKILLIPFLELSIDSWFDWFNVVHLRYSFETWKWLFHGILKERACVLYLREVCFLKLFCFEYFILSLLELLGEWLSHDYPLVLLNLLGSRHLSESLNLSVYHSFNSNSVSCQDLRIKIS